ncbi:hypothetical protein C6497_02070 [Candidatus Poribacteria bacterium]|nr:MAG: hypothetical protein C6497_02070 [Candidatus Poribacteria bacterium]
MFEKFAIKFGADPVHYKLLMDNERVLEDRSNEGKQGISKLSLTLYCVFSFLISIFSALVVFFGIDVFIYTIIGVSMSMIIVAMWGLPHFDNLLSPIYYQVIAHTPISSRTYFMVKLTQILKSSVLLLFCFNTFPSVCGIFLKGDDLTIIRYFFPVVYLPVSFLSGFFTLGVMAALAGFLTKLYSTKKLQKIAKSAQFLLPILFPLSFYLIPIEYFRDNYNSIVKYLSYFPIGWFAGIVSLAVRNINRLGFQRDLLLTGIALGSTLILIFIPLRSIAKTYSAYLGFLLESTNKSRKKLRIRKSILSNYFKIRESYASFCLCALYMRRDRKIAAQFTAGGITGLVMTLLFFIRGIYPIEFLKYHYAIGLSPGILVLYGYFGITLSLGFLQAVRYSQHSKAQWILSLSPYGNKYAMWQGAESTAIIYLLIPTTLFVLLVSTFFWGVYSIFFVLPGLVLLLLSITTFPEPESGLPLSEEFVEGEIGSGCFSIILHTFAIGLLIGVLFLARFIHTWVYVAVYSIFVISGIIVFIKNRKKSIQLHQEREKPDEE